MADQGLYSIFVSAVMLICVDPVYGPRLSNCWLPAVTWVEALQKTGWIVIDVRKFNTAMSMAPLFGSVMTSFDGSNQSGVFRVTYHHQHFYYLTQKTRQAVYPSTLNRAWRDRVLKVAANVLTIPCTRQQNQIWRLHKRQLTTPTTLMQTQLNVTRREWSCSGYKC